VHLLNLLAIPAVVLVYYFRDKGKINWKMTALALAFSFILIALVLYGLIPEVVTLFANTEIWFVNILGLPFNSGTLFFSLLLVSFIVFGLVYTLREVKLYKNIFLAVAAVILLLFMLETSSAGEFFLRALIASAIVGLVWYWRQRRSLLNALLIGFTFILIGYSSFLMLIIRSNANTPIDENNPDNAVNLLAYLNREQYGSTPLFRGPYYNAPAIDREDGNPVYEKDIASGRYVIGDDREGTIPVYDPEYMTIFPRMWNSQESRYIEDYKNWAGITNDPENKHIPTFGENLRFFWRYQINHMYFRYFFWNFVGRQNDQQGMYADLLYGNWLSGIGFYDKARLGPQDNIPASMQSKARNTFYFLPLLFGLLGMAYHFRKHARDGLIVAVLFFMTGLAIVVYLNQQSPQPRERDYAFAASFYAFAIWIGMAVPALYEWLSKKLRPRLSAIAAVAAVLLLVPLIMASKGWDDHDRSGRYTALEMAKNYLNSCQKDAIIFANGDNDTFPLWYAQEVEGIRTDVRVCNLSLLNTDWYIDQMVRQAYDSKPVPFSLPREKYRNGKHDYTFLVEQENIKDYVEVKDLFDILKKDETRLQYRASGGNIDYFPTKKFRITVDPAVAIRTGTVKPADADRIVNLEWKLNRTALTKNYLMMLDMIAHNNWERPVYIVSTTGGESFLGLEEYLHLEGLAYRLIPVKASSIDGQPGQVNTEVMYDNLMNRFEFNITRPGIYLSDDIVRMAISMRNIYSRLAVGLIAEGKSDSATAVADRCLALVPDHLLPLDYFSLPMAEVYYRAGNKSKGDALLETVTRHREEKLEYLFGFQEEKQPFVFPEIQQELAILNASMNIAKELGDPALAKKLEESMDLYFQLYMGSGYQP
jgi:hypothetical protein